MKVKKKRVEISTRFLRVFFKTHIDKVYKV